MILHITAPFGFSRSDDGSRVIAWRIALELSVTLIRRCYSEAVLASHSG
jgi:hypothetical protein